MLNKHAIALSETRSFLYRGATKAINSRIARSAVIYSGNFLIRILIQFGYFVFMVRIFDVKGYGLFSSVTAITFFLANFVGWGCERVLVQRVSVNREAFPEYFGHSLISVALTAPVIFVIAYLLVESVAGGALQPVAMGAIILADTVCLKLAFLCGSSYMAFDNTKRHVVISIGMMFLKLFTLVVAWLTIKNITINQFATWYFISSLAYAIFSVALVSYELGRPKQRFFLSEWRLGLLYSLEYATLSGMKDLDKPIVLAALGAEASGYYAAAFRIVDAAAAPIMGLLYATHTGYFKNANAQLRGGIEFGTPCASLWHRARSCRQLISFMRRRVSSADPRREILKQRVSGSNLCIFPILRMANGIGSDILRAINLQSVRVVFMVVSTFLVMPACWVGISAGRPGGCRYCGHYHPYADCRIRLDRRFASTARSYGWNRRARRLMFGVVGGFGLIAHRHTGQEQHAMAPNAAQPWR